MKEYLVIEKLADVPNEIVLLRTDNFKFAQDVFDAISELVLLWGKPQNVDNNEDKVNSYAAALDVKLSDLLGESKQIINWRNKRVDDEYHEGYVPIIENVRVVEAVTCKFKEQFPDD